MKGDYEIGQIIDLKQQIKKTKNVKGRFTYASVLSGIIGLNGLMMYTTGADTAATIVTLSGVAAAGIFATIANSKKNELLILKKKIENYRSSLTRYGLEVEDTPEERMTKGR